MISLKNLAEATEQEIFDQVAAHLLTQNKQSKSKIGSCRYRFVDDNGIVLRCAAGCLIADDEYEPYIEGNTWSHLVKSKLKEYIIPENHSVFIDKLQDIHDSDIPEDWSELLKELAIERNLQFNFKTDSNDNT